MSTEPGGDSSTPSDLDSVADPINPPIEPPPPDAAEDYPRDAIIFVPGIGRTRGQTIEGLAVRVQAALDQNAATPQAEFRVKPQSQYNVGDAGVRYSSVIRRDKLHDTAAVDLYFLEYRTS